jgi:uncharacterized membrane protein YhaH (DUF805 family)
MEFGQAISSVFSIYATFRGRARRSEYWYFVLFQFLVYFATGILDRVLVGGRPEMGEPLTAIAWIAFFLPSLAVLMRRLHDTGWSGWIGGGLYIFFIIVGVMAGVDYAMEDAHDPRLDNMDAVMGLLVIVGGIYAIFVFVLSVLKGHDGPNRYGPDPMGSDTDVFR